MQIPNENQFSDKTIDDAIAKAIAEIAYTLDSVAIPGFGTFAGVKIDEYIADDAETGSKILYPPQIKLVFTPSVIFRRKLNL